MPPQTYDFQRTLAQPSQVVEANATAGTVTVTVPAPTVPIGGTIYVTRITISGSAAPTAAVEATMTGLPGAVTLHLEIPAQAFAPITIGDTTHPIQCAANTAFVLTIPSLGASVKCAAQVFYYYAP